MVTDEELMSLARKAGFQTGNLHYMTSDGVDESYPVVQVNGNSKTNILHSLQLFYQLSVEHARKTHVENDSAL